MPVNIYDASTSVRIRSSFTVAITGELTDPTNVKLFVSDPEGIITIYADGDLNHESTGIFYLDVLLNKVGVWIYKWQGTGAVEAASPDVKIFVDKTKFPIVS